MTCDNDSSSKKAEHFLLLRAAILLRRLALRQPSAQPVHINAITFTALSGAKARPARFAHTPPRQAVVVLTLSI